MGNWKTPADCKYTKTDEWVRLDGEEALVGLTDYAQDQLSDLVFVEFPEIGDGFAKAEPFGVVESVKAAADINMPIGGKVVMTNDALENAPELINSDAYDKGWLIRIRPSDLSEMDDLMDASAYAQYCAERE